MKRVLVIGSSGQDGTLLIDLLKARNVEYLGLDRRGAVLATGKLLRSGTVLDARFIEEVVESFSPTHVFYLAAHHHSSQQSRSNSDADLWKSSYEVQVLGLAHTLQALKAKAPEARLFYASSSHIFGAPTDSPQNEQTPRKPGNVYGVTKVAGMEVCRFFREQQGLFVSVGILYNHESIYRKETFLSKKVILAAGAIKEGRQKRLSIGNLSTEVDWGYAPDYVDAMVRILDLDRPDDYVIATGEGHAVRELVEIAFAQHGLDYRDWVEEDASLIRGAPSRLIGDASKLRRDIGWSPSVTFPEMIRIISSQVEARDGEGA